MKLDEASLTRQPEEVFDILDKLGEGSYGSVYRAVHKESGQGRKEADKFGIRMEKTQLF
jgi:serine/threonine protein kinase